MTSQNRKVAIDMDRVPILPREFVDRIQSEVAETVFSYSVGIVLVEVNPPVVHSKLIGSGTLVSIAGREGILTARHVVAVARRPTAQGDTYIGFGIQGSAHNLGERTDHYIVVSSDSPNESVESDGPDWAFMVPTPSVVSWLKAYKSFWQLDRWRETIQKHPIGLGKGFWILCGYPGEKAISLGPESGFNEVIRYEGFLAASGLSESMTNGEYDYSEIVVRDVEGGDVELPLSSFGGFSGGGLWWVAVEGDGDDNLKSTHVAYSGIPLSERCEGNEIFSVKCHGWRSVYHTIPQKIKESLLA